MVDDLLTIRIRKMQDFIKSIMTEHDIDIVSLGNHITKALEEAKCNYSFKLINIEGKNI